MIYNLYSHVKKYSTMSNRKLNSIKQLSLHYETSTTEQRRQNFRKQFSEDIPDGKSAWMEKDLGIRISLSAKLHKKERDKPPPVKLAWAEEEHKDHSKKEKQENARSELNKGISEKLSKSPFAEKDSVLYSRQELAERLRQAWKERDQRKQNLNIFLAHNVNEDAENNNQVDKESSIYSENETNQTKIIVPGKTKEADDHFKTIFQKKLRKSVSVYPNFFETNCLPQKIKDNYLTTENKSSTVVVVPVTEDEVFTADDKNKVTSTHSTPREKLSNLSTKENDDIAENPKPINNIVIRPSTAAQRREGFKKRSNSAFQGSITNNLLRPPLLRASSVPSKQEHAKPKFLKRRAKTAKRREAKNEIRNKIDGDSENKNEKKDNVTNNAAEIITMVSLTSPAGSDTEELPQIENNQTKSKAESPVNTKEIKLERNFSLRKAVKSVSFQQSSIHAVRSFSASFPARRGSFASAFTLGNNGIMKTSKDNQKAQEKRSTTSSSHEDDDDYDERVAKRRLVRSKSVPHQNSFEEDEQISATPKLGDEKLSGDAKCKIENDLTVNDEKTSEAVDNKDGDKTEQEQITEMKFETIKEKQCWDMYCKMSQKGVSVSFDTILRGMLTPTEYRMRRKTPIPLEDC